MWLGLHEARVDDVDKLNEGFAIFVAVISI